MQDDFHPQSQPRSTVLLIVRIFLWLAWGALLIAPISFTCVIVLIFQQPQTGPVPDPREMRIVELVGIIFTTISICTFHALRFFVFRTILRRRSLTGLSVAYPIGKIVVWAACGGAVYFNLVVCLIARSFWPTLLTAAAAWLVLAVDVPLMRPFRRLEAAKASEKGMSA